MIKHQFIERATEVTWMFLLVSFWLYVDLWVRVLHNISILDVSNEWFKSSFDISDGIGIVVSYSFLMAGAIPGVRFVLPFFINLAYSQLCSWFDWEVRNNENDDLKKYYVKEEKIKLMAIEANNSTLWNAYTEHLRTKESVIKQQTICQSILIMAAIGFFLPNDTTYIFSHAYEQLDKLSWYVDYPLRCLFSGFLFYILGFGLSNLWHLSYMTKDVAEASEKHNESSKPDAEKRAVS